jgi:5-methylcytosine-specific restriction endonuclease McrA
MPSNWELYPEDWPDIAHRVKEAADWMCQECGHEHDPANGYVLTVHHIDGDPQNNAEDNLIALCQRCHLRKHGRMYRGVYEVPQVVDGVMVNQLQLGGVL